MPECHGAIQDYQSHDENRDYKHFGHSHATPAVADASGDGMPAGCPLSFPPGRKRSIVGVAGEVVTELNSEAGA